MTSRKPTPLFPQRQRPLCPVCGEASYSIAGIHPQCAARRLDAVRLGKVRSQPAHSPAGLSGVQTQSLSPQRVCIACRATLQSPDRLCECGHDGTSAPPSPALPGEAV